MNAELMCNGVNRRWTARCETDKPIDSYRKTVMFSARRAAGLLVVVLASSMIVPVHGLFSCFPFARKWTRSIRTRLFVSLTGANESEHNHLLPIIPQQQQQQGTSEQNPDHNAQKIEQANPTHLKKILFPIIENRITRITSIAVNAAAEHYLNVSRKLLDPHYRLLLSPVTAEPQTKVSNTNTASTAGRINHVIREKFQPPHGQQPWWKAATDSSIGWIKSEYAVGSKRARRMMASALLSSVESVATAPPSTTKTTPTSTDSVHLKLNPEPEDEEKRERAKEPRKNATVVKVHTFVHPRTGRTFKAINTAKRKFLAFLTYSDPSLDGTSPAAITTKEYVWEPKDAQRGVHSQKQMEQKRLLKEWRNLWERQRLLTDRTEFLAVYPSDVAKEQKKGPNSLIRNGKDESQPKRGGFADLLHLYRERIIAILKDEKEDHTQQRSLVTWLEQQYGYEKVGQLKAASFRQYSASQQLVLLKEFMEWFRSTFPYYYDRCQHCGASLKEDNIPPPPATGDDDESDSSHTFMGYVYPDKHELKGKASRTELYKCHKCNSWTRFPRYNSAWHVVDQRRGRCGEYSLLLFRFLRALDHEARWVVDWADHVWAEVHTDSLSWVHLDPCEAAVNENLIYESWGKKQVFILAFYAPSKFGQEKFLLQRSHQTPIIEDVTASYTSESEFKIQQRRDEPRGTVVDAINEAIVELEITLSKL